MNFIKKYLFLIIGVLVVLASLGLFAFGMKINGANKDELQTIQGICDNVPSLRNTLITKNVLEQYQNLAKEAKVKAETLLGKVRQTSNRPVIMADYFPEPKLDIIIASRHFAENYVRVVEDHVTQLKAGDRPSLLEEQKIREDYQRGQVTTDGTRGGGGTAGGGTPGVGLGMGGRMGGERTVVDDLIDNARRKRAESIRIYASTGEFMGYDFWKNQPEQPRDQMLRDSWFTQIAAWIQQDVVDAVNEVNKDSASVMTSRVKRLLEVAFGGGALGSGAATRRTGGGVSMAGGGGTRSVKTEGLGRRVTGSDSSLPEYVLKGGGNRTGATTAAVSGQMTTSWTGRTSDSFMDVVQFEVGVIVDSTAIHHVINALQGEKTSQDCERSQITVLQLITNTVDIQAERDAGYYYGSGSLVELRVICEYVFFHQGYAALIPNVVADTLPGAATTTKSEGTGKPGLAGKKTGPKKSPKDNM